MYINLKSFDWILTGAAILLFAIGQTMLFSTTSDAALMSSLFIKQFIYFFIALSLYIFFSFFPYHSIRRYVVAIYLLGLFSLLLVGQIAPVIRGTMSRLTIFGSQIQPSEFMKIAIIITLAGLFARLSVTRVSLTISAVLVGLAVGLIVVEPDLGMAALICLLWGTLIVFLGVSWRTVSLLLLLSVVLFAASWFWLFADYQKARLSTFIDPGRDPLGAGYNINQSIVAFGSGGLFGRGLGHGPQSQLQFLPEKHTDFILASVGEELGFVGISLITGLYAVLLWRIIDIVHITKDPFGQYLAVSVFLTMLISFFVSAGMNMGLLPVTGIPLPLVSYGGSNLVSTMLLLGLVQSVKHYSHWLRQPPLELTEVT